MDDTNTPELLTAARVEYDNVDTGDRTSEEMEAEIADRLLMRFGMDIEIDAYDVAAKVVAERAVS